MASNFFERTKFSDIYNREMDCYDGDMEWKRRVFGMECIGAKPVNLKDICIRDGFWEKEMELVRKKVIPYQWEALNDRILEAEPSFCMHNYETAARQNRRKKEDKDYRPPVHTEDEFCRLPEDPHDPGERFYGFLFQDSDFSKWLEAVAYSLTQHPDAELEKTADEAIRIVCEAQQEDGYLDTYYILNDITKRFTNLKDNHELYCMGHLIEAAVAYYEATGKDALLQAACRYADCVAEHIGAEEGKMHGYPGHEIAEMALARLYEATGNEKYKNQGLYFINERGKQPYYYDLEHPPKPEKMGKLRYKYHQAHLPVRMQEEAVGHAVRAVYLYSGMADYARITKDEGLKDACRKLWGDITQRKMYITGGIGATHHGEAFSFAYDLPNDTVYAETCASVGMVFFAGRLLRIEADSKYADVMERELYNTVLAGMNLEGDAFFYVNPLEVVPQACREDEEKKHVKPVRQKWFSCACCPPNLARLVSSVGSYAYMEKDSTLYMHLYIGGSIKMKNGGKETEIQVTSGFPWDGHVHIEVDGDENGEITLALRIPGWCSNYSLTGVGDASSRVEKGYLYLTKKWGHTSFDLDFPMEAQFYEADERVREDIGKAALMRGPVVYCLEEADNGKNLHLLKIKEGMTLTEVQEAIGNEPVIALTGTGLRQRRIRTDSGNRNDNENGNDNGNIADEDSEGLYRRYRGTSWEEAALKWIPYYTWANRGEGEMQVWTRI